MTTWQKVKDEIRTVMLTTLYFVVCIGILVALKVLILAQYQIEFGSLSVVFIGALILAKVVLVLEHVPLGGLTRGKPAWVDVVCRTIMYAAGVFVVLLLEKAFEGRHEAGGFGAALLEVFQQAEMYHVWANVIALSAALLGYNALSVLRDHLGKDALVGLFLTPRPITNSD